MYMMQTTTLFRFALESTEAKREEAGYMRSIRWGLFFALLLLHAASFNSAAHAQGAAQVSASATSSHFAPLDRWTAAVRAGDKSRLRDLYSSGPDAFVQTPEGKRPDLAAEEAEFWSGLSSQ